MKPLEFGKRIHYQYRSIWSSMSIRVSGWHSIYDHDEFGEDCVLAIESAEDEVML